MYKKAIKRDSNSMYAHMGLVATYSLIGRKNDAHEAALAVLKIDPEFSVKNIAKTSPMKNQDELKRFIKALRKAGLK